MKPIFLIALLLLAAGCAQTVEVVRGDNYVTFDHAFTNRAADEVRQRAEAICARKKQAALKVSNACSLERCTTSYQCVDRPGATR